MDLNKQRRKKLKLAEIENMSETNIIESNKTLNSIVQNESIINKKLVLSKKENSHQRVNDCEMITRKSDNIANFKKFHKKKRKHNKNNDENVSDSNILEVDLGNNASIEISKEVNQHRKMHKHKSLGEMEDLSNYKSKESGKAETNKILDELYKRKKHKQMEFDKMIEPDEDEKLDNSVNSYKLNKKKKHKGTDGENVSGCRIAETDTQELKNDAYIGESDEGEKLDNSVNSIKLHKNKRKHKETDGENISESIIAKEDVQELENGAFIEFSKGLRRQKRRKDKHKLLYDMENVLNYQELVIDESVNHKNSDTLEVHNRRDKHKHIEIDKISDCAESNPIEVNQDNLDSEDVNRFHKKKKKKGKLLDKMENISDFKTAESDVIDINQNDLNSENVDKLKKKKKKKHKHKIFDEMDTISDCKVAESDVLAINQNDLNSENIDGLKKKKKKKHKHNIFNEMDTISDCKTVESDVLEINQNDLNSQNVDRLKKEKKKKHKLKIFDEMDTVSDCKTAKSDVLEINQNDLTSKYVERLKKEKKKKHKIFDEMDTLSDYKTGEPDAIETNQTDVSTENFNRVHKNKKKKHKHKLNEEIKIIPDLKIAESVITEMNQNYLQSKTGNSLKKKKKSKHRIYDEMGTISDCKTVEMDVGINQNDLSSENANRCHEKKKKKHKLVDEMENIYGLEVADSNVIGISQNDLNKFHQKEKKKHGPACFSEMEIICNDNIQESVTDEAKMSIVFDTLDVQKRNKCKSSHVDKTVHSDAIEINQDHLSDRAHKAKRKNHGHNSSVVKNLPRTVIESNNSSNDVLYHEHKDEKRKKGTGQNSVANKHPRKNKKHEESIYEMQADNFKKNLSYKGPKENFSEFKGEYLSFGPFMHDLSEEPVSFFVPLLHENEAVTSITQERRRYLEENGVTIHTGRWTKAEDDILTRNFLQFGAKFRVNNPFQLLGINQSQKDNNIEMFKKAKHFLVRLGKDLDNRSLRSIYMRARKLFTPLKNSKKLSAEETVDLKHAHEMMGNKWTRISEMLARSDDTCHSAFRWHKKDIKKGKWTPEEEEKLIKALKTLSGSEDVSANNLNNIAWQEVAKYVPTRNEFQCHKQWAEHLAWDTSVSEKKKWTKYHFGKLVYLLKEKFCVNSEQEIDWRELHKHFVDVAPSYIFLHKKWYYLKRKLPKGFDSTYSKCLDAFKRMYEEEYKDCANENV